MFKFFKSKSTKEASPVSNIQDDLFDWKFIDVTELDNFPDAVKDIYDKKYNGIIIRNVCSKEEVAKMKAAIEAMDQDIVIPTGVGHSYPRLFAQLVKPDDDFSQERDNIKSYFSECEQLPETLNKHIDFDFSERIESVFEKIAGGRSIEIPKGFDGEGRYPGSSIRVNYPGKGFIMIHCGNYFQQEFPAFYEHLMTEVNVKDQLSYFLTVNPAEVGGDLTLFDLLWKSGQTKESARHDNEILLPNGAKLDTSPDSPLKRIKVKPEAGDLLIFSGGPIWHKVELVEGTQNRITVGGFLALTEDEKTLKYWT
jgi:hypothetical protein